MLLQESPSLKPYFPEAFHRTYEAGVDLAVRETNLPLETFPAVCPYILEQALDSGFLPR